MNKAKPQEEGILVMPDDIELREPRLKIPGKKPVGPVVVNSSMIGPDHALYLCNDLRLTSGDPTAGHLSDSNEAGYLSVRTNSLGNRYIHHDGTGATYLEGDFFKREKGNFSLFFVGVIKSDTSDLFYMFMGRPPGEIRIIHRLSGSDIDLRIVGSGDTYIIASDLSGGVPQWVSYNDVFGISLTVSGTFVTVDAINYTTGVTWASVDTLPTILGSTALLSILGNIGNESGFQSILAEYKTWPRAFAKSLLRDPYQFLKPK